MGEPGGIREDIQYGSTEHTDGQLLQSQAAPRRPTRKLSASRSGSKLDTPQHTSRPPSAGSDPTRLPDAASIAYAIQAENSRVKLATRSDAGEGLQGASVADIGSPVRPGSGSSRPPTRPSSKAGRRLPVSAEAASEGAPPSVLGRGAANRQDSGSPVSTCRRDVPPAGSYQGGGATSSTSVPATQPVSSIAPPMASNQQAPQGGAAYVPQQVAAPGPAGGQGDPCGGYPDRSASQASDRPVWLEGVAPLRSQTSFEGPQQDSAADWRSGAGGRRGDEDLMQSLRALDHFRTSHSRRFFGSNAPPEQHGGDMNSSCAGDGGGAFATEAETAVDQVVRHASLEGLHIPVIDFNEADQDAMDGLMGQEERPDIMGSSLLTAQLEAMQSVIIPTLPCGQTLVLNCVSTWGDTSFLGLAGIEIFDGHGMPVVLKDVKRQVVADPPSINVLPEYDSDPRTVDKLFDQVNLTRDDLHVWLSPLFPGRAHTITIDLEHKMQIAMIRVWNYNKSRLHSSRGVRDMEILLDGSPIFVGEIRRAPGLLTDLDQACEHILFTQDETILLGIENHDWLPGYMPGDDEEEAEADGVGGLAHERPCTAGVQAPGTSASGVGEDGRPMTQASAVRQCVPCMSCSSITLVIYSTWGDPYYVGMTGLDVLDSTLSPLPLDASRLDASPRDLNDLEGVAGDVRTLDKLLDGVHCTTEDSHMWLAPFIAKQRQADGVSNTIRIDLGGPVEVAGFHMWNYNKNLEDTSRGIKELGVFCDDRYVATFLCRKAPGHVNFDFKQVILLSQPPASDGVAQAKRATPSMVPRMPSRDRRSADHHGGGLRTPTLHHRQPSQERARSGGGPGGDANSVPLDPQRVQQQYETPTHPGGFLFKFVFLSTWSDVHYVGLDGIELIDLHGAPLRPTRAHSNHGSVRDLPGMENDIRREENLLHGDPGSSGRMWLAPVVRQPPNAVELVFDEPVRVSCIRFWNYARTPSRGARDIEIFIDDLLVYQGVLRQRSSPGMTHETILFTSQPEIVAKERQTVYLPDADDLICFYDVAAAMGEAAQRGGDVPLQRPMTALLNRPQ